MTTNYTSPSSYGPPPPASVLTEAPSLLPFVSDALLTSIGPIIIYWILSLGFHYVDTHGLLDRYRLHTPEEVLKRNHVSRTEVIREVIIQQVIQFCVGMALGYSEPPEMTGMETYEVWNLCQRVGWVYNSALTLLGVNGPALNSKIALALTTHGGAIGEQVLTMDWRYKLAVGIYWGVIPIARLSLAIFVLDTWQYFWHRTMHNVPFLYRTLHSRHHRLYVPYAFGALYNHPIEGLLLDTVGAALAYKVSGMSLKGSIFFFIFGTMKTVDDHCGYKLPYDPLQLIFSNNAEYHDIHHQGWGVKTNFSQPFLICWDRWLGTQYTGNDAAERNARTRNRIHRQVESEKSKAVSISEEGVPVEDEYAARRAIPEEDDVEFLKTSTVKPTGSITLVEGGAETPTRRKTVRRTRASSIADATVKDVTESLRDTGKWVNGVVGNVSGAKMR